MFAGTASGYLLPPYVVYKAENLYDSWTEGEPKGTRYNRSKSGFPADIPKAMIDDNLASHITCCN